jgi:hypothetical protein
MKDNLATLSARRLLWDWGPPIGDDEEDEVIGDCFPHALDTLGDCADELEISATVFRTR